MVMLVSLQQASDHLRRDTTDDDDDLELKIIGASASILNYLKSGATFLNSDGDVDYESDGTPVGVPYEVQIATLMLVGILYRDREGRDSMVTNYRIMDKWQHGYLPLPVTSLLYPLRDPAMA
jgi:hypothetical protein